MPSFTSILVANRGEIACRVIAAARGRGYTTVAVYSDADANARHVSLADRAVRIGPSPPTASYLSIEAIIEAARISGADAVHPGYGFLSENAEFAEACAEHGLVFIGPTPSSIRQMGNKAAAKRLMVAAGVPCVPGYQQAEQGELILVAEADRIGFPIMVKAAAGGGGRGMRLVQDRADLPAALASARSEAAKAFGSGELILEKAVIRPRHVEIQILADLHGHVIHLGERDCSVQRRHQKVIEEAPCPVMTPELRADMGRAAVQAARSIDYQGVGTVEFLLDAAGHFYFLEMNTRIQVEHPVTEMVTGIDLVGSQIDIAAGQPLGIGQEDVRLAGHAIEARLYAEDPSAAFLPQTGHVRVWRPATGEGVRIDHGLLEGDIVSPFYDPMQAKVIAHGATREEARHRLVRALGKTTLLGVKTNKRFLIDILDHPEFIAGEATTGFLQDHLPAPVAATQQTKDEVRAMAAAVLIDLAGPAGELQNWWSSGPAASRLVLDAEGEIHVVAIAAEGRRYLVSCAAKTTYVEVVECRGHRVRLLAGGREFWASFSIDGARLDLEVEGRVHAFEDGTFRPAVASSGSYDGIIRAPMNGVVGAVRIQAGMAVEKGAPLLVLEAMKMEHSLSAPDAGVVREVRVRTGDQVATRHVLVVLEKEG